MVSGGSLDDDTESSKSGSDRPKYDAAIASYNPWSIKAKAWLTKKGMYEVVVQGTLPTTTDVKPTARYHIMNKNLGSPPVVYTENEVVTSMQKGDLPDARDLIACKVQDDPSTMPGVWQNVTDVYMELVARNVKPIDQMPSFEDMLHADEQQLDELKIKYHSEIVLMIDDKKDMGKDLLLEIDEEFPWASRDAHELWNYLQKRATTFERGSTGKQIISKLKVVGAKFVFGMTTAEFTMFLNEFRRTWRKLPVGFMGIEGSFFEMEDYGLVAMLQFKPFAGEKGWFASYKTIDQSRGPYEDSVYSDIDAFCARLVFRYEEWYVAQGGDGETRIKAKDAKGLAAQGGKGAQPQDGQSQRGGGKASNSYGGRGKGKGRGKGMASSYQTWKDKSPCPRCWVVFGEANGHDLYNCDKDPQVCKTCGSDGAKFSCGGEYDPAKCQVAFGTTDSMALFGNRWRATCLQIKCDLMAKGTLPQRKAQGMRSSTKGKEPVEEDEEEDEEEDTDEQEWHTQIRRGRGFAAKHAWRAYGRMCVASKTPAAPLVPKPVHTFETVDVLHKTATDMFDDTPIMMIVDGACKPKTAVSDLRLLVPGSLKPISESTPAVLTCGGGDLQIVATGTLARFVVDEFGDLLLIKQVDVYYVPDLYPHNLMSTGSLWRDNKLEAREPKCALERDGDGLLVPCVNDDVGNLLIETLSTHALCDRNTMVASARFAAAASRATLFLAASEDTPMLSVEAFALSSQRKGTENQVRNYLLWHARLGDLHHDAMVLTAVHSVGHAIPLNSRRIARTQLTLCNPCVRGKLSRMPKPADKRKTVIVEKAITSAMNATRVGQLISLDTWGPFKVAAHGSKYRYAHAADDAYSGLLVVEGSTRRGTEVMKKVDVAVRAELINYGANVLQPIEIEHTDGASEFDNDEYVEFLNLQFTQWRAIVPHDSPQMGRLERKWRTLGGAARSMLLRGDASLDQWYDAIQYAAQINTVVTRYNRYREQQVSPHERCMLEPPDISNFHVFNAPAYALIFEKNRDNKMTEVAVEGRFIGFAPYRHGALIRTLDNRRVIAAFNHIKVDDAWLAFKSPRLLPAIGFDDDLDCDAVVPLQQKGVDAQSADAVPATTAQQQQKVKQQKDFSLRDAPDPPQSKYSVGDRVSVDWSGSAEPGTVAIHPKEQCHSRVWRYKSVNKPPERQLCITYDDENHSKHRWHDEALWDIKPLQQTMPPAALLSELQSLMNESTTVSYHGLVSLGEKATALQAHGIDFEETATKSFTWEECSMDDPAKNVYVLMQKDGAQIESLQYDSRVHLDQGCVSMALKATLTGAPVNSNAGAKVGDSAKGVVTPKTMTHALSLPESKEWYAEAQSEHKQVENARLALVPRSQLPPGAKVLKNKWVFKIKTDEDDSITRFKVRGVGGGNRQRKGRDYVHGYFPTAKGPSWRSLLFKGAVRKRILVERDIPGFYLQAKLSDANNEFQNAHAHIRMFMEQFEGFEEYGPNGEELVNEMDGSLYGFVQAGRAAGRKLATSLVEDGKMRRCVADRCVYVKRQGDEEIEVAVIVDNMFISTNSQRMLDEFDAMLTEHWGQVFGKITGGPLHASGALNKKWDYDQDQGILVISSPKQIESMLSEFMSPEAEAKVARFSAHTPTDEGIMKLSARNMKLPSDKAGHARVKRLRSLVMSLNYVALEYRPDIAVYVSILTRFAMYDESIVDTYALQILKYLGKTRLMGIACSPGSDAITGGESENPAGWFDANWVVHDKEAKHRSMSGRLYRQHNASVLWTSKGQERQALSSTGAELDPLVFGVADALYLRDLAHELNVPQKEPTKMYSDNTGAVFVGEDAAAVRRSRADARQAVFLQDCVEDGLLEMKHWPGNNNVADILTKWLDRNTFTKYRAVILNLAAHRKVGIAIDD